jgi:hypothetical protein
MLHALALSAFLSAQTVDTLSTVRLLQYPAFYHESNPIMPSSIGGIVAVKSAVAGSVIATAWSIRKSHPRWSVALFVIGTASGSFGAIHNMRLHGAHD